MVSSRKNLTLIWGIIVLGLMGAPRVDAGDLGLTDNRTDPFYEGVYPKYPETKPASRETEAWIKKGEYLSKMGDCIACHSNVKEGGAAFAGGLPIKTPFGTFYSPNITPDKETGIGSWSLEDFSGALRHGRDPKGRNYFPVFPYVYLSNLSDDDIKALYIYYQNIPAVHQVNIPPPFPFNLPGARLTLWGWNLLFFFPNTPNKYDETQSSLWNRGKYIVDGPGHCSMCHTPLNVLGAPKSRFYLTGSFIDGYWAPNITKFGLHAVSHFQVADVFKKNELLNQAGPVSGPMAEVNHNSLRHLTKEDRLAIATYLKTVVSEEPLGQRAQLAKQPHLKRGKQVYVSSCIICHQNGEMSAPIIGQSANWYNRLQESGLHGLYRHVIYGFNSMPIKGACVTCSDGDITAAVDYILKASLTHSQSLELKSGGSERFPSSGKEIYQDNCSVCHDEGKMGAPKLGDKEMWAPYIAQNMDKIIENTLNGKAHPKNGGCTLCDTAEVINAIKYMVTYSSPDDNYSLW